MNQRVRSVLLGLGLGVAVLLLLDLAGILAGSVGQGTSPWWVVACYLATGVLVAVGVAAGRGDRLVPVLAALVVVLVTLPSVDPSGVLGSLPQLTLGPANSASRAVAFVAAGALGYAAVRGGRA
ncbi:MAG: hypothetical protein ACOC9I_00150 [Actinomycetota bacterium]